MADTPAGWRLRHDGQPYPDGVELDAYGEPHEAAGFYALRDAFGGVGRADSEVEAWNTLAALRALGFDVAWERRSELAREIERLTAANELLRQHLAELRPVAAALAKWRRFAHRHISVQTLDDLRDRMANGEFDG